MTPLRRSLVSLSPRHGVRDCSPGAAARPRGFPAALAPGEAGGITGVVGPSDHGVTW